MTLFRIYWLLWFFGGFLGVELFCLARSNGGTLSETIWWLEGWRKGQSVADFRNPWLWTAGHCLVTGSCAVLFAWVFFHFALHLWA